MKAAVLAEKQRIIVEERSKPVAGSGEVVVAVSHCGICGSDVHGYMRGMPIKPGTVMGHECTGTVSQVGEGVGVWSIGDRVAVTRGSRPFVARLSLRESDSSLGEMGLLPVMSGFVVREECCFDCRMRSVLKKLFSPNHLPRQCMGYGCPVSARATVPW